MVVINLARSDRVQHHSRGICGKLFDLRTNKSAIVIGQKFPLPRVDYGSDPILPRGQLIVTNCWVGTPSRDERT